MLGAGMPRQAVSRADAAERQHSISAIGMGIGLSALAVVGRQITRGERIRGCGRSKSTLGIRGVARNSGAGAQIGCCSTATTRYPVTHPRASTGCCLNEWRTNGKTRTG
jgi:hypothetical protein